MKKLAIVCLAILTLLASQTAYASGPGPNPFSDIRYGEENEDWFALDAVFLSRLGVIKGYSDGTFKPANNVNRAELAAMLWRLYDAVMHPEYEKWEEFSNSYYSVWYPEPGVAQSSPSQDCSTVGGDPTPGDFPFYITCYDAATTDVKTLTEEIYSNPKDMRYSSETVNINGITANQVTKTMLFDDGSVSDVTIMIISTPKKIFVMLGTGYEKDNDRFFRSFKLKN